MGTLTRIRICGDEWLVVVLAGGASRGEACLSSRLHHYNTDDDGLPGASQEHVGADQAHRYVKKRVYDPTELGEILLEVS